MISEHFTIEELTTTSTGLPNEPGNAEIKALRLLAVNVLEPVRASLGVPLRVTSGYRSPAVNRAIKGAKGSQHMIGEAADVRPVGLDIEAAFRKVASAVREGVLPCDQAIIYAKGNFMHLSYTAGTPRREVLRSLAPSGSGGPYVPYEAE